MTIKAYVIVGFVALLSACGIAPGSSTWTPIKPSAVEPLCKPYAMDTAIDGDVKINVLYGNVSLGCGGVLTCGSDRDCRIEMIFTSEHRAKIPIGAYVNTLQGTIELSERVEVLGGLWNKAPVEHLQMCGYVSDFFYVYIAMSKNAKTSAVVFQPPPKLCD